MTVDELIVTMPSVVFDAVFVAGGSASVRVLKASGDAVHFVREAFKHSKAIGALGEGADFLTAAGVLAPAPGDVRPAGVSISTDASALSRSFIADISVHRHWARANKDAMAA